MYRAVLAVTSTLVCITTALGQESPLKFCSGQRQDDIGESAANVDADARPPV
jgi:hypothetical protein